MLIHIVTACQWRLFFDEYTTTTRMPYLSEIYDVDVEELDVGCEQAQQPDRSIGLVLKPHQRRALHRCRQMEEVDMHALTDGPGVFMRTTIGIYGDGVGAGKSHVMLALIAGDKSGVKDTPTSLRTFADGRIQLSELEYTRPIKTTLVVIPHILAMQWESYIQPLARAGLKTLVVSRMKALDRLSTSDIGEFDLILVTNSFYDNIAHLFTFRGVKLRRVIIDEADTIAISSSMSIKASFTWFITASYGNLVFPMGNMRYEVLLRQNVSTAKGIAHQGFIRMLFTTLHNTMSRGHFKRIIVKNSDQSVQESMTNKHVTHVMVSSLTPHSIRVLTGVVDRIVMECLNAGDVTAAIEQIAPENRHTEQNVVGIMAESYTHKMVIVEGQIEKLKQEALLNTCDPSDAEITRLTLTVNDLQNKIACMRSRLLDDDICCICLENTRINAVVPCCATKMCLECVARWVMQKSSCVLCRRPLTFSDLHVIEPEGTLVKTPQVADADMYGVHYTKMQNMEVILRAHSGAKALIYSNHDKSFEDICACLTRLGKTYDYIRGGHKQISNTVEAYKDDRIDVLLINATHYGSGLNLENTTDIMMFHALNTEIEKQVVGRAQRMGRTCDLRVWHLLHENEMQLVAAVH